MLSILPVFTKCKASIKDGHRLENISWRLWHRELALSPSGGGPGEARGLIARRSMEAGSDLKEPIPLDEKGSMDGAWPSQIPG